MHHFLKLALLGFVYSAMAFDLEDYATTYRATRDAYLKAANELKLATGPYKAARDAYVAATATYTKSLYERRRLGEKEMSGDASHLKILQSAYWNAGSSESADGTVENIVKFMDTFKPSNGRKLFDLEDYATTYRATRDAYLKAANELKLATGPYKAARDAYVAATATYTKSLYERRRLGESKGKLKSSDAAHLKVLQDAYWHAGSSESASHTAEAIEKILSSM
jgi:ABC-type transporter lipoprotein component MlaA